MPVLEVGGSHVAAAWVDVHDWSVSDAVHEADVAASGSASQIVTSIAECAGRLGDLSGAPLGVAIPGPFDYQAGIGRYVGVGKFESLADLDVGQLLQTSLSTPPRSITFVNDADAFGLGEWVAGAASGCRRAVAITLGTGVGSAFVVDGAVVAEGKGVPPQGSVHLLRPGGVPLESRVSTRAIVGAYGRGARGVADVVRDAQAGDGHARSVLEDAFGFLGVTLGPGVAAFGAEVLVIGGKIAAAWALIEPFVTDGLSRGGAQVRVVPAANLDGSGLVGTAYELLRQGIVDPDDARCG